jgi:hypothetical protein
MRMSNIGVYASLLCVWISGNLALTYLKKSPRLFTAMALFAFIWALLIVYWGTDDKKTQATLSLYASFLLVYIGGLLEAHAKERNKLESFNLVDQFQYWSVALLLAVVTGKTFIGFGHEKVIAIVDELLFVLGFFAIWMGMRKLSNSSAFFMLTFILTAYIVFQAGYLIPVFKEELGDLSGYNLPMNYYPYFFAAFKVVLTLVFGCMVAYVGMSEESRRLGVWKHIGRLM